MTGGVVAHVVEASSAGPAVREAIRGAIAGAPAWEHRVLSVGGESAQRADLKAGIGAALSEEIPAQLASPWLERRRVRAVMKRWRSERCVAWSAGAMAATAGAARCGRVAAILTPPAGGAGAMQLYAAGARGAALIFGSGSLMQAWRRAIGDAASSGAVAAPPVPPIRRDAGLRASIRRAWGVPPGVCLLLAAGDVREGVEAWRTVFSAGVLNVTGRSCGVVIPAHAAELDRSLTFLTRHERLWPVIVEDRWPGAGLAACDVVVWLAGRGENVGGARSRVAAPGVEILRSAACAGIPIVAEDHPAAREALQDADVVWCGSGSGLDVCRAVILAMDGSARREPLPRPDASAFQRAINAALRAMG